MCVHRKNVDSQPLDALVANYNAKDTLGLHISCSLIAGLAAAFVSTPLDVIKVSTIVQDSNRKLTQRRFASIFVCAVTDDERHSTRSTRRRRHQIHVGMELFRANDENRRRSWTVQRSECCHRCVATIVLNRTNGQASCRAICAWRRKSSSFGSV
jgi:hypothetical protein